MTLRLPNIPVSRVENLCATGSETLRGADPIAAARYANAAAALSTTEYGAVTPIPNRAAVIKFLRDS